MVALLFLWLVIFAMQIAAFLDCESFYGSNGREQCEAYRDEGCYWSEHSDPPACKSVQCWSYTTATECDVFLADWGCHWTQFTSINRGSCYEYCPKLFDVVFIIDIDSLSDAPNALAYAKNLVSIVNTAYTSADNTRFGLIFLSVLNPIVAFNLSQALNTSQYHQHLDEAFAAYRILFSDNEPSKDAMAVTAAGQLFATSPRRDLDSHALRKLVIYLSPQNVHSLRDICAFASNAQFDAHNIEFYGAQLHHNGSFMCETGEVQMVSSASSSSAAAAVIATYETLYGDVGVLLSSLCVHSLMPTLAPIELPPTSAPTFTPTLAPTVAPTESDAVLVTNETCIDASKRQQYRFHLPLNGVVNGLRLQYVRGWRKEDALASTMATFWGSAQLNQFSVRVKNVSNDFELYPSIDTLGVVDCDAKYGQTGNVQLLDYYYCMQDDNVTVNDTVFELRAPSYAVQTTHEWSIFYGDDIWEQLVLGSDLRNTGVICFSVSVLYASTESQSSTPTSSVPSQSPTLLPTKTPTVSPTASTSVSTTSLTTSIIPTRSPTSLPPSSAPTLSLTSVPTTSPSVLRLLTPSPTTGSPTATPSAAPSAFPTLEPTFFPSASPTLSPTLSPSISQTSTSTKSPTTTTTVAPTTTTTTRSTTTKSPTLRPTASPTLSPTHSPTNVAPVHSCCEFLLDRHFSDIHCDGDALMSAQSDSEYLMQSEHICLTPVNCGSVGLLDTPSTHYNQCQTAWLNVVTFSWRCHMQLDAYHAYEATPICYLCDEHPVDYSNVLHPGGTCTANEQITLMPPAEPVTTKASVNTVSTSSTASTSTSSTTTASTAASLTTTTTATTTTTSSTQSGNEIIIEIHEHNNTAKNTATDRNDGGCASLAATQCKRDRTLSICMWIIFSAILATAVVMFTISCYYRQKYIVRPVSNADATPTAEAGSLIYSVFSSALSYFSYNSDTNDDMQEEDKTEPGSQAKERVEQQQSAGAKRKEKEKQKAKVKAKKEKNEMKKNILAAISDSDVELSARKNDL